MAFRLIGLGWYLALCIVLGITGGLWMDKLLGTMPLFVLVGIILGSVVGFVGAYKLVVPMLYEGQKRPKKGQDRDL